MSCFLELQELVTSSYIKVMGVSLLWQAPDDNYLQDKGSVKMHKAPGKILAALNDNFAINFTDK